jgi:hypothetical protein
VQKSSWYKKKPHKSCESKNKALNLQNLEFKDSLDVIRENPSNPCESVLRAPTHKKESITNRTFGGK